MTVRVERSVDLQLMPDVKGHPFEAFEAYRDVDPFWAESGDFYGGGFWVLGRFDQCRDLVQDASLFRSEVFTDEPLLASFAHPPDLQKFRRVLLPQLSRSKTLASEGRVRELAKAAIDTFVDTGGCDLVADFAQTFPIAVFAELFGLDEASRAAFRGLAAAYLHGVDEERLAGWDAIREIVRGELEIRRGSPRDDLLSGIANSVIDGEPTDMETCVNLAGTIFLGGLDTLPAALGWTFNYLATHEEARNRIVADPSLIPTMAEECLRLFPAVATVRRQVARDVRFHGVEMRAGDRVVALLGLANRDETEFPNPRTADLDRPLNRHLSFGVGPHRCLGSHLASIEVVVALEEWHRRIPNYWISDFSKIRFRGGVVAMSALPLAWRQGVSEGSVPPVGT